MERIDPGAAGEERRAGVYESRAHQGASKEVQSERDPHSTGGGFADPSSGGDSDSEDRIGPIGDISYVSASSSAPGGVNRGGQAAPVFRAETLEGGNFDLSSYRGRVVLLDFWFKTCGPCLRAMPKVAALRDAYPENQLVIAGVNNDRFRWMVKSFLKSHTHEWTQIHNASQDTNIVSLYGVRLFPHFVVIDQAGNVQYRGSSIDSASAKIAELIAAPSIPTSGSTPRTIASNR